jgi:prepilin-type N-terminal cleavage/methylation domain-containing protein
MGNPQSHQPRQRGFTLIEMMVVVIIITILAAMAIANYIRMQEHAKMASCVSNQRNIHQAATIYASDHEVPDGEMPVEDLLDDHGVARTLCDCPSGGDDSDDDYTLVWLDGLPRDVRCDVKDDTHRWSPH